MTPTSRRPTAAAELGSAACRALAAAGVVVAGLWVLTGPPAPRPVRPLTTGEILAMRRWSRPG